MIKPTKYKSLYAVLFLMVVLGQNNYAQNCNALYIAGVIDGPLTGGVPKMVQVCANTTITDLSDYGLGSANNGGGTDGQEYTFPSQPLNMGDCFTVSSETSGFQSFFGCTPDATSSMAQINGDDAIELFCNGSVVDVYGDPDVNGGGQVWEYTDGWGYASDNIPEITFDPMNWQFSGPNALDGATNNSTATTPYPGMVCSTTCSINNLVAGNQSVCNTTDNSYTQDIEISYANAPTTGMLNVNGQLFGITTSPQLVTLVGLNADGNTVDVNAFFSDDPACTSSVSNLFTAPINCTTPPINNGEDTLRVMTYNILNFPNPSNTNSLGEDAARITYFRQIVDQIDPDIIVMQELKSLSGMSMLTTELNNNGTLGNTYDYANTYVSYGGLGNGLIYKTSSIAYESQSELPRNNSLNAPNGNPVIAPRANTLYNLYAINATCTDSVSVEIISGHFKAGDEEASGSEIADRDRRNLSVLDILDYTDTQPNNANIIVAGDFNMRSDDNTSGSDSEPGYVYLIDNTNVVQFVDPLGGFVRNITADADKYTQSTRQTGLNPYGNGGASGGLDDRFDFIFISDAMDQGLNNVQIVANSYDTPGSPEILNSASCDSTNPLCAEYEYMSDHYPVVLDIAVTFSACAQPCVTDSIITQDYVIGEMDTIAVSNNISADNTIGGNATIIYKAGNCIELNAGFEVQISAIFEALIAPCGL